MHRFNLKQFCQILKSVLVLLPISFLFSVQESGAQNLEVKNYALSSAKKLVAQGTFNIYLTQGAVPFLRAEGPKDLVEKIHVKEKDNLLSIDLNVSGKQNFSNKNIRLFLELPEINEIQLDGNIQLIGENEFSGEHLSLVLNGAGKVSMALYLKSLDVALDGDCNFLAVGTAKHQSVSIRGAGNYKAEKLENETSDVLLYGLGNAHMNVSQNLTAKVYGTGNLYFKGSPKVHCQCYSLGDIRPI